MRKLMIGLAAFAIIAAACAPEDDTPAASDTDRRGSGHRRGVRAGRRHPAHHRGHAHDRHGQPGVRALVRRQERRRFRVGVELLHGRSAQRRGLRECVRVRPRRQMGFDGRRGRVGGHPVRQVVRAGTTGLRLRDAADLLLRQARRGGRLQRRLLRREPGADREQRLARDRRHHAGRPQGPEARRADRHHQPAGDRRTRAAERRAQRLRRPRPRAEGPQERPDRRRRRRLPDGVLRRTPTWSWASSRRWAASRSTSA